MNIEEIQNEIKTLENDATTFSNVSKLATLYIVNEHLQNGTQAIVDAVQGELNDILPSYISYKDAKKQFQFKNGNEDAVNSEMEKVCREIYDFIKTLYSNTENQECRNSIKAVLTELNNELN